MALKIFKTLEYAPAVIAPKAVAFLIVVVFTRILDPDQFGLYALIIVYGEFIDSVVLSWSRVGVLRFYHKDGGANQKALLKGGVILLFSGLLVGTGIGMILASSAESTRNSSFYLLLMLYFYAVGFLRFSLNVFRAQDRVALYVGLEIIRPFIGFIFAWLLVRNLGASYIWLILGYFGTTGLVAILLLPGITHFMHGGAGNREAVFEMIRYALPFTLVLLLGQVLILSDRFLLNLLIGTSAVGFFSAAHALAAPPLLVLFQIIYLNLFPRLIKIYEQGGVSKAQDIMGKDVNTFLFICLPVLTLIYILSDELVVVLVGDSFQENAPLVIRLLALGAFLTGFKALGFDRVFHLKRKIMLQSYTLVLAVFFNIGLNVLLIPKFGGVGAASATLSAQILALVLSVYYSRRYLPYRWLVRDTLWICLATILMGCAALLIQAEETHGKILFSVPLAMFVYLLVCRVGRISQLD